MHVINLSLLTPIFGWFNDIIDLLDTISFGGLFTMLDLLLGILLASAFIPLVLNISKATRSQGSAD